MEYACTQHCLMIPLRRGSDNDNDDNDDDNGLRSEAALLSLLSSDGFGYVPK